MLKASFVGAGNLAYTIVAAHARAARIDSSGLNGLDLIRPSSNLVAAYKALKEILLERSGIALNLHANYAQAAPALSQNPLIILAVKPLIAERAIKDCANIFPQAQIPENRCVISVMAGVTLQKIKKFLQSGSNITSIPSVIRCMPNTPMAIGLGVTGVYFEQTLPVKYREWCEALFKPTGELVQVPKETDLDTVTALSGSGPAFFYRLMEKCIKDRMNAGATQADARSAVAINLKAFCEALKNSNKRNLLNSEEPLSTDAAHPEVAELFAKEQATFQLFIDNMIKAGQGFDLPLEITNLLVLQTGIGAAGMVLEYFDTTIEQLRANVTSKGGTTFTGLEALNEEDLTGTISNAVRAARERAVQLSHELSH